MNVSHISNEKHAKLDRLALILSSGFLLLFIFIAFISNDTLANLVNVGFAWSVKVFGAYWQVLLLLTFIISLILAFTRTGSVRMGKLDKPEIKLFVWIAIILCTLLAGGGVFWAAAEPISHYLFTPPLFGEVTDSFQKASNALAQSFMHWGFLAWAILGGLTALVLMHLHYDKGLPLKPRTLLYPVFGERAIKGPLASIIDACCIIAVAAGTIGPIGFLGLQISYSLNFLFNIPDGFTTQLIVVLIAIVIYTVSAVSGVNRGIQILSRYNVYLASFLLVYIFVFGPTGFIINSYIQGLGNMLQNFIPMSVYRGDEAWLSWWTVFFWGWFLGYGPMMAVFIARISRGRTIRDIVLAICILAPVITMFWFTIVGGTGLFSEINNPGSVSELFNSNGGFNLPGTLIGVVQSLPLSNVIAILFLILTTIFIVTTGDSMTYTISVVIGGTTEPNAAIRVFWGILMGLVAIILLSFKQGGIAALQSFIVITAVPVSLILLPSLWTAPRIARQMAKEQNLI